MDKVLVISLGRKNSLPIYASSIYEHFDNETFDLILSQDSYYELDFPEKQFNVTKIKTYNSGIQFLIYSLFYLPFPLLVTLFRIRRYNVLYLPYFHFWNLHFILLFRLFGKRVVYTVHDGVLHTGENSFLPRILNNLSIRSATELIFLTNYVQALVCKKFDLKKESYVVPHGILNKKETEYYRDIRKKKILFFGRISKYKGVELLMESFDKLNDSDAHLIIAGKSIYDIHYLEKDNITIIDQYIQEEEIEKLFQEATILVIPYLEATQSGVISLGINYEVPMICTQTGGLHEQLNEDEAVWVKPEVESLKKGMETLLNDRVLYNKLVNNLKVKKTELSWEEISKQTFNILQ